MSVRFFGMAATIASASLSDAAKGFSTMMCGPYGAIFFTHSPCLDAAGQTMTTSGFVFSMHAR